MVCKGIQDIRDKKPRPPLVPVSLVEMLDGNLRRIAASPCSTSPALLKRWARVGGGSGFVLWTTLAAVQAYTASSSGILARSAGKLRCTFFCVPKFSELSFTSGCPAWHKSEDLALRRCWTHLSFCPLSLPPLKQSFQGSEVQDF